MEDHKQPELFRGHFDECFEHFVAEFAAKIPKFSKEAAEAKKSIAEFCGLNPFSIKHWITGRSKPKGTSIVKMMCYLNMVGYRIIELEKMSKAKRHIVELIGFGILSMQEAADLIGYGHVDSLHGVIQRTSGISRDKEQKMWEIWKVRKEALEQKKVEAATVVYGFSTNKSNSEAQPGTRETVKQFLSKGHNATISIMEGLLEMLEQEPPNLESLQESTEVVLRLSSKLSDLSARLLMSQQERR